MKEHEASVKVVVTAVAARSEYKFHASARLCAECRRCSRGVTHTAICNRQKVAYSRHGTRGRRPTPYIVARPSRS